MKNDKEHLHYTLNDKLCAKAIEAFKDTSSVKGWLQENRSLFDSVTLQPPDLPRIVAFNLGSEIFGNIRKFGRLYETIDDLFEEEEKT